MNYQLKEEKKVSRSDIAFCLAGNPESETLYFGSSDSKIYGIDFSSEKPEPAPLEGDVAHTSYVTGLATIGSDLLVSGSYDRRLIWWNTGDRMSSRCVEDAHGKWIRQVKVSPDQKIIASVADDMICRLWQSDTAELIAELKGHDTQTPHHYPSMLFTCEFSADGSLLATADKVGRIVIWDVATGSQKQVLEAPTMYTWDPSRRRHSIGGIRSLAFSPDGKQLAAGGMGQVGNIDHLGGKARIRLFELETGKTQSEIEASEIKGLVEKLEYHPEGQWLMACGGDHKGFTLLIDPATGKTVLEEKLPAFHVHDFLLKPGSMEFVAVGHNQLATFSIGTS